ncbi:MAG: FHA domain-containing protein [Kiritimatiellia bacterium]|nr:FHA domain-containing protein [Kiritimatiellia bacterium]
MILRYKKKDGSQTEFEIGDRPITIGRGPDADLVILDDKASRVHCGIRQWDGDFYIKDLKSRNGTFVNGDRIDMVKLNPGDRIRVGRAVFSFETTVGKGHQTILQEVADEMSGGKGYTTLLREIIEESDPASSTD